MNRYGFLALTIAVLGILGFLGHTIYTNHASGSNPFAFGLDLVGGSHLVYEADVSSLEVYEIDGAMQALREVIERRTNLFGVSEPLVQVEKGSVFAEEGSQHRLIIELPGVTDLEEAVRIIGETPQLEFKLVALPDGSATTTTYEETGLTGRYLSRAELQFGSGGGGVGVSNEPIIGVTFTNEGKELFATITREHVGRQLAIFLDGELKSDPVINEPILGGEAIISGGGSGFDPEEARDLVRDLNIGALPVPITLASTQTVGASLGTEILEKGVYAGMIGLGLVIIFMALWYRVPGISAGLALISYVVLMLGVFMYIGVTITAAGIAGFLLSIGMAVDANVLIFERLREGLREGKGYVEAIDEAFFRAWPPIRDGNFTSLISAVVLFWLGTGLVQGFALVFGVGILVSMFSALVLTRLFLHSIALAHTFFPGWLFLKPSARITNT
jgi:preprotein translocase subunit SecD